MKTTALVLGCIAMACALLACGDDGDPAPATVTCGAGTTLVGTECVRDPDPDPDTTAPGAVTGLAAVVASGGVTLTWTNPADADFDSVIVVRRSVTEPFSTPGRGLAYAVADELAPGDRVIAASSTPTATDAAVTPGLAFYAVYARDTSGNWSAPARVRAQIPIPAQTATISISITGGVITPTVTQPANYDLTVMAGTEGTTLRLNVTMRSKVGRPVFNPKLVITALNQGTAVADGTFDGKPYVYYGLGALAPGASRVRTLSITDATGGADPVILSVNIVDHPMLMGSQQVFTNEPITLVDTGTMTSRALSCTAAMVPLTPTSGCSLNIGPLSADGQTMVVGSRNEPVVMALDTASLQLVGGVTLAPGVGSVMAVAGDATGTSIYAVLNRGQHGTFGSMTAFGGRRDAQVELVRLDAHTLVETGRVIVHPAATGGLQTQGKALALSPDGKYAAVPVVGAKQVYVVDLATMTLAQTIDLTAEMAHPRSAAFSPDSASLVIGYSEAATSDASDGHLTKVTTSTWAKSSITATPAVTGGLVPVLAFAPDGSLWVARANAGLGVINSALDAETRFDTIPDATGSPMYIAFSNDGRAFIGDDSSTLAVFDVATRTRQDFDGVVGAPITNLPLEGTPRHSTLVTPF